MFTLRPRARGVTLRPSASAAPAADGAACPQCCCAQLHPLAAGRRRRQHFRRGSRFAVNAAASSSAPLAAVIPGNSAAEFVVLDGTATFLNLYNNLLIARVVLSWFPSAAQVPLLRPLYTVCDPFLNAFRGIIPPLGGLDLSPIIGFTLISTMSQLTGALGAELERDVPRGFGQARRHATAAAAASTTRRRW